MVDRTKDTMVLYKKDGTKVLDGKVGETTVTLTGLTAGTKVASGDYQVSFKNDGGESDKVNVPAFEVPATK